MLQQTHPLPVEAKFRNNTQDQSDRSLQIYQLAVENASDHIVITDGNGQILYANRATEHITGYPRAEIIGSKAGVKWGKQMKTEVYQQMWHELKVNKKTFVGEFTNIRKNGQPYIAEAKISPILDDAGNVMFFVGIERDVTKLREVDRMKSEFISLASHQLRTPLAAMKWFLEMLLAGDVGVLAPEQQGILINVNESNERMIGLVNTLLNISRIESGTIVLDPKLTQLSAIVQSVLAELQNQLHDKQQTCAVVASKDLTQTSIDQQLIRQVYMNLLTNAMKYSPAGSKITISLSVEGNMILSQVQDAGYGIPIADKDKIFQRFFRAGNAAKQVSEGSGLGLYLVKSIIESSGGKIWFTSEEGKGTTFAFTLPIK